MDYEDMLPKSVLPNGPDWVCVRCMSRYPESYEPLTCVCGGSLGRILAYIEVPPFRDGPTSG